jgi:hypothetical protein
VPPPNEGRNLSPSPASLRASSPPARAIGSRRKGRRGQKLALPLGKKNCAKKQATFECASVSRSLPRTAWIGRPGCGSLSLSLSRVLTNSNVGVFPFLLILIFVQMLGLVPSPTTKPFLVFCSVLVPHHLISIMGAFCSRGAFGLPYRRADSSASSVGTDMATANEATLQNFVMPVDSNWVIIS